MRIALQIEYNGKNFCGSQWQGDLRTVQSEIETALCAFLRCPPLRVVLSGRTDSGVHARGQILHFDYPGEPPAPEDLDLWRLCWGLNGILKKDIAVVNACLVKDEFHARYKATQRTYVYRILNRPQRSALDSGTKLFISRPLNVSAMQEAARPLLGTHDFSAFRSTSADPSSPVCTVERADLLNLGEGELEFWISANHFVYNMVRIIVGTLVEIGLDKRPVTRLTEALSRNDRELAGPTAPPWGLTLVSIRYPEEFQLFGCQNNQNPVREVR